jgi:hypothetical protein
LVTESNKVIKQKIFQSSTMERTWLK